MWKLSCITHMELILSCEALKLENLSWLYSERAMMMKEGLISEFEDGGREEQAKEAGSL